jgi:hypothetical protein
LEEAGVFYGNKSFSDLVRRCADQPQDGKLQQELRNWIGHFQSSLHYDQVSLLDAACNEWISVPAAPCGHSSLTIQKARESIRSQQIVFADFYPNESTRKDYLRLFVPVLDDSSDHRLLGVLMLRIDPEAYLAPFIQRWPVPSSTGEMVLLRREGNEVLVLDALWFQNNSGLALRMPLDRNEDLWTIVECRHWASSAPFPTRHGFWWPRWTPQKRTL